MGAMHPSREPGRAPAPALAASAATLCGRPVTAERALVMAIINRTPDSFYDQGATFTDEAAMDAVRQAVDDGADLVDIGGVKAGPGDEVDEAQEIERVIPFLARVRDAFPDLLISVDTYRPGVARRAGAEGVDLINDTWGGVNPDLLEVVAEIGAGLVCSHTGGAVPRTRPHRVRYTDVVQDVLDKVVGDAERAVAAGVARDSILVDPTHDFGKNTFHGLALLRHVDALVDTGWPVLMALSNKDFIGETLGVGLQERLEGTLAATALAAAAGARVFRVHEVAQTRRVLEMVGAIVGTASPARTVRGLA